MYGEVPELAELPIVRSIECEHDGDFRLSVRFLSNPYGSEIDVLTAEPRGESKGHLFGLNFDGNHSLTAIESVPLSRTWASSSRTGREQEVPSNGDRNRLPDAFPLKRIVSAGFSVSTFFVSDVLPDRKESSLLLREIHPSLGAVGIWAWSLASVAHTIESALPITYVGHSRFGKAALCAGALFGGAESIVAIQSGTGGAAPFSTSVGESVEQLVERFLYWFQPSLQSASMLSFDADSIFAACAPARILLLGAEDDAWADPFGSASLLDRAQEQGWVGADSRSMIRAGGHRVSLEDWDEIFRFLSDSEGDVDSALGSG